MTPREARDQARAAAAQIRRAEADGERLLDEIGDAAPEEQMLEITGRIIEAAFLLAEGFERLDGVMQLQPAPDRSWLSRLFGRR